MEIGISVSTASTVSNLSGGKPARYSSAATGLPSPSCDGGCGKTIARAWDGCGATSSGLASNFRLFLLAATFATVIGALLIPTFQRYFSRAVIHFQNHRSIPRLALHVFSRGGISTIRGEARFPSRANVTRLATGAGVSWKVIALNVLALALRTVGVFASLYAGFLKPELSVTCANLSSVLNGFATIVLTVIIDPHISVMTDDVIEGRVTENRFRRAITTLIGARVAGTILAQAMMIPAALLIVRAAEAI
jgi:hypothetical protein